MASGTSARGRLFSFDSLAGWVFADLLLVLFLVGLGSAVAYTPPEPPPEPPKLAPIVGMKTTPTSISIQIPDVDVASGAKLTNRQTSRLCSSLKRQLAPVRGERAALVLVFGGATDVVAGQNVARAVASQLSCASKSVFGEKVANRAFWDGGVPLGQARLEVFLFTTQDTQTTDAVQEQP